MQTRLSIQLITFLLFFASIFQANAQRFSYVYIQGDKENPFYVKYAGEMLPRYGKNYTIISQLGAGAMQLEILFQQNKYPPLNFTIQIPDNGFRGFLLTRHENTFALYDIQQRFYLMPGQGSEDRLPEIKPYMPQEVAPVTKSSAAKKAEVAPLPPTPTYQESQEPVFIENIELKTSASTGMSKTESAGYTTPPVTTPIAEPVASPEADLDPVIAAEKAYFNRRKKLASAHTDPSNTPVEEDYEPVQEFTEVYEAPTQAYTTPLAEVPSSDLLTEQVEMEESEPSFTAGNGLAILNSDCPDPLSDPSFAQYYTAVQNKKDDDKKIIYLLKTAPSKCFSSRQAFLLARLLHAESMRYSFLKKVYPRITDQHNFPLLEKGLFRTLEWKSYFKLIYQ